MDTLARPRAGLTALALAALAGIGVLVAGCGEAVVVVGDPPGIMRLVAGVVDASGDRVDSLATATEFRAPAALAVGDEGVLYVADAAASRLFTVGSDGRLTLLRDDQPCTQPPCLGTPAAMALDAQGGVLVADAQGNRILRRDPQTGRLVVLAGNGNRGGAPDGTPATAAPLDLPAGVAAGPDGRVYFSEATGGRVRVIRADGTLGTVAGGDGSLGAPEGIAVVGATLYVADPGSNRVLSVPLGGGAASVVAGAGPAGFAGDGGPATQALLSAPADVAVSPDGLTLFVADAGNHRVRAVELGSGLIETYAGSGDASAPEPGHTAAETPLADPSALAVSPLGYLFVADVAHRVVWRTPIRFQGP